MALFGGELVTARSGRLGLDALYSALEQVWCCASGGGGLGRSRLRRPPAVRRPYKLNSPRKRMKVAIAALDTERVELALHCVGRLDRAFPGSMRVGA